MEWIEMPLDEACRLKNEIGRQEYGGDYFIGDWLPQAFEECLDKFNYVEQGIKVEPSRLHPKLERLIALELESVSLLREIKADRDAL